MYCSWHISSGKCFFFSLRTCLNPLLIPACIAVRVMCHAQRAHQQYTLWIPFPSWTFHSFLFFFRKINLFHSYKRDIFLHRVYKHYIESKPAQWTTTVLWLICTQKYFFLLRRKAKQCELSSFTFGSREWQAALQCLMKMSIIIKCHWWIVHFEMKSLAWKKKKKADMNLNVICEPKVHLAGFTGSCIFIRIYLDIILMPKWTNKGRPEKWRSDYATVVKWRP